MSVVISDQRRAQERGLKTWLYIFVLNRHKGRTFCSKKLGSALTRLPYHPQHNEPNQPTKGLYHLPIGTKLPPAYGIPTEHASLRGQEGPLRTDFLHEEVQHRPCQTGRHWTLEILLIEGENVAHWPPEAPCYPEYDFASGLFGELLEARRRCPSGERD